MSAFHPELTFVAGRAGDRLLWQLPTLCRRWAGESGEWPPATHCGHSSLGYLSRMRGKIEDRYLWLIAGTLFAASLPVIWLYASFDRQAQGILCCLSVSVLIVYALQFPQHLGKWWLYVYVATLVVCYVAVSFVLPNELPRKTPTSFALWPFALISIAVDALMLRAFSRLFDR